MSTELYLRNPSNAFTIIDFNKFKIAIDPWVKSGIYDGGWTLTRELKDPESILKDVTHLYITHIHEDHCDHNALKLINRDVVAFIPNVFAANIIEKKLRTSGINNIIRLSPGEIYNVDQDLQFEVINAMNNFGQELELYSKSDAASVAIDTGIIITVQNRRLVFLADNTPYNPDAIGSTLDRIKGCDLLAYPYNGAASDYPICYSSLSHKEMIDISNKREEKREISLIKFFNLVKPKLLLPYSSDFLVSGPAAPQFNALLELWWAQKTKVAERYTATTGIKNESLMPEDLLKLNIQSGQAEVIKGHYKADFIETTSQQRPSEEITVEKLYPYSGTNLDQATQDAAEHMFDFMKKLNLKTDWLFQVNLKSTKKTYTIDFSKKAVLETAPENKNILKVILAEGYYEALIKGLAHWNNAQLSFQLDWKRIPNIYCNDLYTSLNFFHIYRNR